MFALPDPDYESGYGSRDPIESESNPDTGAGSTALHKSKRYKIVLLQKPDVNSDSFCRPVS